MRLELRKRLHTCLGILALIALAIAPPSFAGDRTSRLCVHQSAPGISIYIDGRFAGTTNASGESMHPIPPGEHVVLFRKRDFAPYRMILNTANQDAGGCLNIYHIVLKTHRPSIIPVAHSVFGFLLVIAVVVYILVLALRLFIGILRFLMPLIIFILLILWILAGIGRGCAAGCAPALTPTPASDATP